MSETATPNADQITYWNTTAGPTWAELAPLLDRQIEEVGLKAMDALALKAGEHVLDVGCGSGQTSLELARRVGPQGLVLGIDIARPMLEVARRRLAAAHASAVRFLEADAQTAAFPEAPFDALFSRFGVMFFAEPTAAFRHLAGALKPGGRLAFVCWRAPSENLWMSAPMAAAAHRLPPAAPPEPGAPGPFAFADPERVRAILAAAGFAGVEIAPFDTRMGGNSLEDSLTLALRIGPLGAALREHPDVAASVRADVRAALESRVSEGVVWQDAAVWIVTARRP